MQTQARLTVLQWPIRLTAIIDGLIDIYYDLILLLAYCLLPSTLLIIVGNYQICIYVFKILIYNNINITNNYVLIPCKIINDMIPAYLNRLCLEYNVLHTILLNLALRERYFQL